MLKGNIRILMQTNLITILCPGTRSARGDTSRRQLVHCSNTACMSNISTVADVFCATEHHVTPHPELKIQEYTGQSEYIHSVRLE
jgi:hypothetical protein